MAGNKQHSNLKVIVFVHSTFLGLLAKIKYTVGTIGIVSEGKKEERERNSVEMVTKQDFWIIALLVTQSMSLVAPLEAGVYVC